MDTGRTGHGEEARGIDRRSPRPIRYEEIIYHTRRGRQLRAGNCSRGWHFWVAWWGWM